MIVFDIETRRLNTAVLEKQMLECKAPATYKDPEKIEAKILEKQNSIYEKAQLDPLTSEVAVFGVYDGSDMVQWITGQNGTEADCLSAFMEHLSMSYNHTIYSFNGRNFDVPYLIARSIINGITLDNLVALKDLLYNHYDLMYLCKPHTMSQDNLYMAKFGEYQIKYPLILQHEFEGDADEYSQYLALHNADDLQMLYEIINGRQA